MAHDIATRHGGLGLEEDPVTEEYIPQLSTHVSLLVGQWHPGGPRRHRLQEELDAFRLGLMMRALGAR